MRVTMINTDGHTVSVPVGDPTYAHLVVGTVRIEGEEGFVVAVRDVGSITGDSDKWRIYVDRYHVNVDVITPPNAKREDDLPPFAGGDDTNTWQIGFMHDGHAYLLGNRINLVDRTPINRLDPDTIEVRFERGNTMVDVTLL